ncbi:MAG: flagellar protein FliO/FliZ [Gammaproteobacteria bacterium]|jgi:flagellar protein FliO/FliZ
MRVPLNSCCQIAQRLISGISIALLSLSQLAMAAEPVRPVAETVSAGQIINLLAGLVTVLLAFFAVIFLLKRLSGFNGINKGHMRIVDAMHLGTKERIIIVKVANQHLLLGVSPQGIHPLHVLTDDIIEEEKLRPSESQTTFNQLLSKMKFKEA